MSDNRRTDPWPFADPPDTPVLTTREIVDDRQHAAFVRHDEDDASWQFHVGAGLYSPDDARVSSLDEMLRIDASVAELASLPLGWVACRESGQQPWRRLPQADWDREHGGILEP